MKFSVSFAWENKRIGRDRIWNFLAGEYDVAVVGAGHAGCEAALAAARLGVKNSRVLP